MALHGRTAEIRLLETLVRTGRGALVLRGPAGVGKTALLRHAATRARGCRVVHVRGLRRLGEQLGAALPDRAGTDPFATGVATAALLSAAAPLLCVVDDAQRLDERSALALVFAARRVSARVVLLFAERDASAVLAGVEELPVAELCRAGARALVRSLVSGPVDADVVERFVAETRGNPGVIRAAVDSLDAGGFGVGRPSRRGRPLTPAPGRRTLLLTAAADPTGDVALLWRAAGLLGIPVGGPLRLGERVTFPDPSSRGRIYHDVATPEERRTVHRALAETTTAPDWRSWHHANSVSAPDPAAAAALVAQVPRARARGGPRAAAAFLRLAATLTPDPAEHTLAAVAAELDAGRRAEAWQLLRTLTGPLEPAHRAEAARLRAWLTFSATRTPTAATALVRATREVPVPDPRPRLDALGAAVLTDGRLLTESLVPRDSLVATLSAPGAPSWLAGLAAAEVWDEQAWHRAADAPADPGALPDALAGRALLAVHKGDLTAAAKWDDEARAASTRLGQAPPEHATALIAAWRGRPVRGSAGPGLTHACAELAAAVAANALGDHARALAAARRVVDLGELATAGWALLELIEAAAHSGRRALAASALEALVERTDRRGTDWARGAQARGRALVASGPAAEERYLDALRHLARTRLRPLAARTRLGYGEWLRRQGRTEQAREVLRAAHQDFRRMGAAAFATRAWPGDRSPVDALTGQETRIATLARAGLTNAEIGTELSLSPRTAEYHLRKVFTKLGITSRTELHLVDPAHHPESEPPSR
ncbi:LuxR C-terminal-related transcriptional regulator [Amycolatopsis rhabdoformis]|uniref:LuxR C-terminal-related transcriptional regulator n=1 Tax=Amycolatopsis rhabdoformis TaxID=1448059 RepID=A0ABZ1IG87_9PSEU|nr:LuxR C-terminal-related transcriptional regulator [Amycolatopsis rhabdoformis]WSE32688.1 LuxR C-terminal-related transcriptional regulator [Amycolatopsis rhabdoformis]